MDTEVRFTESDFKHEFTEVSSEVIMFPKYREKYIAQTGKYVVRALEAKKLSCAISLESRTIEVATNSMTRDPFIFIKAVNFVKLVGRGVDIEEGMKVLEDDYFCEVIDIKRMVKRESTFERRRDRLIGPKGATLKAIQILTKCYVLVHGKTVSVVGGFRGIEEAKGIVIDCMNNIHPVYQIKRLIEKRKLEDDGSKSGEDWERFLPKIKKSNKKSKKVLARTTGGMPLDVPKRKEDVEMETGEYFMSMHEDERGEAKRRAREARMERRKKKEEKYVAPDE